MAIGYMRFSNAQNARRAYDYNARQGQYTERKDLVAEGSENMPAWAEDDPAKFWQAADTYEKGNKAKAVIIALPKELPHEKQIELVQKWVKTHYPNHAVSWAIHDKAGALTGQDNPHAHLLICEREIDYTRPEPDARTYFAKGRTRKDGTKSGGYRKSHEMSLKTWSRKEKQAWQAHCNAYLKEHGINARIDFARDHHRQGGKSVHLGNRAIAAAARGVNVKKVHDYVTRTMQTMEARQRAKEWKIGAKYAAPGSLFQRVAWTAKAWISHPQNRTAREHSIINSRIRADHRKITVYKPQKWDEYLEAMEPDTAHNVRVPYFWNIVQKSRGDFTREVTRRMDKLTEGIRAYAVDNMHIIPQFSQSTYQPPKSSLVKSNEEYTADVNAKIDKAKEREAGEYEKQNKAQEQHTAAREYARSYERKPEPKREKQNDRPAPKVVIKIHRQESRGRGHGRS